MQARLSSWAIDAGIRIIPAASTLIYRKRPFVLAVKDIFTTIDGSWEPSTKRGSLPQWARDAYLKPWGAPDYFDDAGGHNHIFQLVLDENGRPITDLHMRCWSDGYSKLGDASYTGFNLIEPKPKSGWANIAMFKSSAYTPPAMGPWCAFPDTAGEYDADVVVGIGLPWGEHISTFVVYWRVPATAIVDPPAPPPDPPSVELSARVTALEQRIDRMVDWIASYRP